MGLLSNMWNCGLRIRREYRERFPRHRLQRKPLVSDPGKRSRHSWRVRNTQFYVSRKRPIRPSLDRDSKHAILIESPHTTPPIPLSAMNILCELLMFLSTKRWSLLTHWWFRWKLVFQYPPYWYWKYVHYIVGVKHKYSTISYNSFRPLYERKHISQNALKCKISATNGQMNMIVNPVSANATHNGMKMTMKTSLLQWIT